MVPAEASPVPRGLCRCLCVCTHAVCNAWLHSAGESFLASLLFPYRAGKITGCINGGGENTQLPCSERHPAVRGSHPHPQNSPLTWTTASRCGLLLPCVHLRRVSSNAHSLRQPHSHIHSGSLPSRDGNSRATRDASPRYTCSGTRMCRGDSPWRTDAVLARTTTVDRNKKETTWSFNTWLHIFDFKK